nr:MAG TPA: hypothetical protein [Caudoviricetes sp.]
MGYPKPSRGNFVYYCNKENNNKPANTATSI